MADFTKIIFCFILFTSITQATEIGVYDLKKVFSQCDYGRKKISEIQTESTQMTQQKQSLMEEIQNIRVEKRVMPEQKQQKAQEKIKELELELAKIIELTRIYFDNESKKAQEVLITTSKIVLEELLHKKGLDLIIPVSEGMVFKDSVDVSEDLIKDINLKLQFEHANE